MYRSLSSRGGARHRQRICGHWFSNQFSIFHFPQRHRHTELPLSLWSPLTMQIYGSHCECFYNLAACIHMLNILCTATMQVRLEHLQPCNAEVGLIVAIIYWAVMFRQNNAPVIANLV